MRYDHKEKQRDQIKLECARLGLKVEQRGQAYAITGRGVSILCCDIAVLEIKDIQPYDPPAESRP